MTQNAETTREQMQSEVEAAVEALEDICKKYEHLDKDKTDPVLFSAYSDVMAALGRAMDAAQMLAGKRDTKDNPAPFES